MPSTVAIFIAGFHLGIDFGLWWAYPDSVPLSTVGIIEFVAAMCELALILRLDAFRVSWPSADTVQRSFFYLTGLWLVWDLSVRYLRCTDTGPGPLPAILTTHYPNQTLVAVDPEVVARQVERALYPAFAYTNAVYVAILTQMRVALWMFMDYLAGSDGLIKRWDSHKRVLYHVQADNSYVFAAHFGRSVGHATFVTLQQAIQMDWLAYEKTVEQWDQVPAWIRIRLCNVYTEAA